jgi:hypothetical protein
VAHLVAVGAVAGERVEGVDDGEVAGDLRDLGLGEVIGIAGPVHLLVVVADEIEDGVFLDVEFDHAGVAGHGVLLDDLELLGGEPARLLEDLGGDVELADVMQRGGVGREQEFVAPHAPLLEHGAEIEDHAPGVGGRRGVLGLDLADESVHDLRVQFVSRGRWVCPTIRPFAAGLLQRKPKPTPDDCESGRIAFAGWGCVDGIQRPAGSVSPSNCLSAR